MGGYVRLLAAGIFEISIEIGVKSAADAQSTSAESIWKTGSNGTASGRPDQPKAAKSKSGVFILKVNGTAVVY